MTAPLHHHRPTARRLTGAVTVGAVALSLALAGCGQPDSGTDEAQAPQPPADVVAQQDYTTMPDAAPETSEDGTTQVRSGALVITPEEQRVPMAQSWPLPAAQSVTLTATWGAPSGPGEPTGTWMMEVWGRDPGAGIWLACWSDGTPAELVDMATSQVLAKAPDGECGSAQSMTLTVDNSVDAPYSAILFQAGGSAPTSYLGDQRYPLEFAGYRVIAEDTGFAVALESITIEVG